MGMLLLPAAEDKILTHFQWDSTDGLSTLYNSASNAEVRLLQNRP